MSAAVHILGIRHHGPGSARSLRQALKAIGPDAILIEGPPEAEGLTAFVESREMAPPVAILVYRPEAPRQSVYYPFAEFSPEWQALRFALRAKVPVRFMDLPVTHWLAQGEAKEASESNEAQRADDEASGAEAADEPQPEGALDAEDATGRRLRVDPLQVLGEAAGFGDGERWWEHVVEHRRDGADVFAAILEAMREVRAASPPVTNPHELRREAHMRKTIRAAMNGGHTRIAVVCGAWHAPALVPETWPDEKSDTALLKGLPKCQVAATWVPWSHGRLGAESGYGAGVESPGWYHHLWSVPNLVAERWMCQVGRFLREEGLDASPASAIEAVRLAETLAALRGRYAVGLDELNEATRTIYCFGDDAPMRLIRRKLIVGERLGRVPPEAPMVPLMRDLQRLQRRLRLAPDPAQTTKEFDLREPTDLERSRLLHRLALLGVPWGKLAQATSKGTFKEAWILQWEPEFAVGLVEASLWGSTILDAATAKANEGAEKCPDLARLAELLDQAILADLPDSVDRIMIRLEAMAAVASDVTQLMNALPPLANLLRYGNVRQTDAAMVAHATQGMIARICIGLPGACSSLDDDAASQMFDAILKADSSINLIRQDEPRAAWHATLARMSTSSLLHGLVAGRCTRILLDAQVIDQAEAARRLGLAVSTAAEPAHAAAWIDGFLRRSGELLYHDDTLFALLDHWLADLTNDVFAQLLPLLRRTFSTFDGPLRRNLGEKAKRSTAISPTSPTGASQEDVEFDHERARTLLPLLSLILDLDRAP